MISNSIRSQLINIMNIEEIFIFLMKIFKHIAEIIENIAFIISEIHMLIIIQARLVSSLNTKNTYSKK